MYLTIKVSIQPKIFDLFLYKKTFEVCKIKKLLLTSNKRGQHILL